MTWHTSSLGSERSWDGLNIDDPMVETSVQSSNRHKRFVYSRYTSLSMISQCGFFSRHPMCRSRFLASFAQNFPDVNQRMLCSLPRPELTVFFSPTMEVRFASIIYGVVFTKFGLRQTTRIVLIRSMFYS